jgi:hypothetical protein
MGRLFVCDINASAGQKPGTFGKRGCCICCIKKPTTTITTIVDNVTYKTKTEAETA